MQKLIRKLHTQRSLSPEEYLSLLTGGEAETDELLYEYARKTTLERFGNGIYIRGLIEITNICRNDCLYCGIRKSNQLVRRYTLSKEEILECCRIGRQVGFRTFVLQGGELPEGADGWIEEVCRAIRDEFPDCALTLSLGERRKESYERFFKAGASRYLLRHETHNPEHYSRLHPCGMSLEHRLSCLDALKSIGYQTGTGFMVGSPYQTLENIVEDILYIQDFRPEMIGIGPYIPHKDTPLGAEARKEAEEVVRLTCRLIAIFRLMLPDALIPSTTALSTIAPDGRERGILAGANVVMPNLSPAQVRDDYSLYENKAAFGAESAEGLADLESRLRSIGYTITVGKGDWQSRD